MTELVRVLALTALASALLLPVAKREKELAQVSAGLLYLSVFLYAMAQLGGLLGTVRTWLDSAGASVPHADVLLRAAARALELLGVVEVILAAQPILSDLFGFAEKMLLN